MTKIKSIAELIQMKEEIKKNKTETKTFFVESLESTVTFKPATRVEIIQARKLEEEEIDAYIIFSHLVEPNLNDEKLQKAFNAGNKPHMIVDKLLKPNEVGALALTICGMRKAESLDKVVKN